MDLCVLLYQQTNNFPNSELYGLTSQIRRCAVSIPSNIAEGRLRGHIAEYKHFLHIAYGSAAELETQLIIARRIGYLKENAYDELNTRLVEVMKMLNKLLSVLKS